MITNNVEEVNHGRNIFISTKIKLKHLVIVINVMRFNIEKYDTINQLVVQNII